MLYPQQTATRTLEDLSGMWKFRAETEPIDATKPLSDFVWMAVPASFNDQTMDQKLRNHLGYFWYETGFNVPVDQLNKRNVLRFGSVTHNAEVYVNGKLVVSHTGGFMPFEVDVTEQLVAGENDLKVRFNNLLDNSTLPSAALAKDGDKYKMQTRFDFYNYSGIHRPVRLYTTGATYLDHIWVNYTVDGEVTKIHPEIHVAGDYVTATVEVIDEAEEVVANSESLDGELTIEHTHRWQSMNAYLYKLRVTLRGKDNELLDTYTKEFGVRTIKVENGKILVNEKPVYLTGFGRHEDSLASGKGLNMPLVNMDYQIMKNMGANSFRTSHYPYSEESMQQADREGFLVIDEVPAVSLFETFNVAVGIDMKKGETWKHLTTHENHKQALSEMIERDSDHPSVIMWSVANEPASHEDGAHEYFEEMINYTKELDNQKRPVTVVNIQFADADHDLIGDLLDVICLNRYFGWYIDFADLEAAKRDLKSELEKWHQLYPDKPIMFTEFGGDTVDGMHSLLRVPYSEEYQVDYYKANFEVFDELDYVVGEQLWAYADFVTDPGMIRIGGENRKGIFTRDRKPKMVVHYLKDRWTNLHHN